MTTSLLLVPKEILLMLSLRRKQHERIPKIPVQVTFSPSRLMVKQARARSLPRSSQVQGDKSYKSNNERMKQNKTSNLCPTVVQGALQQCETPLSLRFVF